MNVEDDWEDRLRAAVEATIRERQRRRDERAALAEARRHGLAARHNAKLARQQPATEEETPA